MKFAREPHLERVLFIGPLKYSSMRVSGPRFAPRSVHHRRPLNPDVTPAQRGPFKPNILSCVEVDSCFWPSSVSQHLLTPATGIQMPS
jgi:hypothetical protein